MQLREVYPEKSVNGVKNCEEHGAGGAVIGDTTIRSLAFVDDIINTNSM